jgi:5-methylcytosine-specific restriction endonuclease McrA
MLPGIPIEINSTVRSYIFMRVLVLDQHKHPLDPCHPARARDLLKSGRAKVYKRYPFIIIMQDRSVEDSTTHPHRIKLDPGSRISGIAILNDATGEVVFAAEIEHRGGQIKSSIDARRNVRRSRRQRKTRYRKPRFSNRRRKNGWLAPSLQSRVENLLTWISRLKRYAPVEEISMEIVSFNTQLMQNPEISSIEYQQGELMGYEVRQYILEKWGRECAYCGKKGVPLQIDHIHARSKGGTDRVSNLTLACHSCNQKKGNKDVREFLKNKPERLARVEQQAKTPLKDAAAVSSTRWELYHRLKHTGASVEVGSGGLTKYNRTKRGLDKSHWGDAACVGSSTPLRLRVKDVEAIRIKAVGYSNRQMRRVDKYGFPRTGAKGKKQQYGYQTGDIVKAVVNKGKKKGVHIGKVAVRASGNFNIETRRGVIMGISHRYCKLKQRADGYAYGV